MMIKNGGMISVSSYDEFYNSIEKILTDKAKFNKMSNSNANHFKKQKGAIKQILRHMKK
jgi:3-deoxy-D-manno-octulosonic-acid transferase